MGLHQGQWPAGPDQQAHDQRRRQPEEDLQREEAGVDVRDDRAGQQAPQLARAPHRAPRAAFGRLFVFLPSSRAYARDLGDRAAPNNAGFLRNHPAHPGPSRTLGMTAYRIPVSMFTLTTVVAFAWIVTFAGRSLVRSAALEVFRSRT